MNAQVQQAYLELKRTKLLKKVIQVQRDESRKALALAKQHYLTKGGLLIEWQEAYTARLHGELAYWNLDFKSKLAIIEFKYATGKLAVPAH